MVTGAALAGALSTGIFGQARKGKGSSLQWLARNRPDLLKDETLKVAAGMLPQMPLRPSAEPDPNAGRFGPDFAPARAGALGGIQRFRDQAQEALAPTAGAGVEGAFPIPPVREPQRPGFFGTRDPGSRLIGEVMRRREEVAARAATEKRNRWQLDQTTRMEGEDRQAAQREQETKQAQQFKTEQVRQEREVEQQKVKAKRAQDAADEVKKDNAKRLRWDIDAQRASDAGLGMTRVTSVRSGSQTLQEAIADRRRETTESRLAGSAVSAGDRRKDAKDKAAEDFAARLINMRLIAEDRYPAKSTEVQEAYAVEWARGKGAPPSPAKEVEGPEDFLGRAFGGSEGPTGVAAPVQADGAVPGVGAPSDIGAEIPQAGAAMRPQAPATPDVPGVRRGATVPDAMARSFEQALANVPEGEHAGLRDEWNHRLTRLLNARPPQDIDLHERELAEFLQTLGVTPGEQ